MFSAGLMLLGLNVIESDGAPLGSPPAGEGHWELSTGQSLSGDGRSVA